MTKGIYATISIKTDRPITEDEVYRAIRTGIQDFMQDNNLQGEVIITVDSETERKDG